MCNRHATWTYQLSVNCSKTLLHRKRSRGAAASWSNQKIDQSDGKTDQPVARIDEVVRHGRGRPPGSKNKPKPAQHFVEDLGIDIEDLDDLDDQFVTAVIEKIEIPEFHDKQGAGRQGALSQAKEEGIITTPGTPFETSRKQEIEGLIAEFSDLRSTTARNVAMFAYSTLDLWTRLRAKLLRTHTRNRDSLFKLTTMKERR
jgi:hypothetical protein